MNNKLYTIYDRVSQVHMSVFMSINDGTAYRMYSNFVKTQVSAGCQSDDFELHLLGEFEVSSGTFIIDEEKIKKSGDRLFACTTMILRGIRNE